MNGTLAKYLRKERIKKGLTQGWMAETLHISRSMYASYESGKRVPDFYRLEILAGALGIPSGRLTGSGENVLEVYPEQPAYSLEDYFQLKDYHDFELLEGKLFRHYTPTYRQQTMNRRIAASLYNTVKARSKKYEVVSTLFYFVLDRCNATIVQPDVALICDFGFTKKGICYGAPDIVIETVREKNPQYDYCEKLYIYYKYGVREFWVVDPKERRTTVYNLEYDIHPSEHPFEEHVKSHVIKGLTLNFEELLIKEK